jgi:adenylosuccinate lyase
MSHNLNLTLGLIYSQNVQALVADTSRLPREEAYKLVRDVAQECWDSGMDFFAALNSNPLIRQYVSHEELKACFNLEDKIKYRDYIFSRIFGEKSLEVSE